MEAASASKMRRLTIPAEMGSFANCDHELFFAPSSERQLLGIKMTSCERGAPSN